MGFLSLFRKTSPAAEAPQPPTMALAAAPVSIMPSTDEQYQRHVMRTRRVLLAMEKAHRLGQDERIAEFRAELASRVKACAAKDLDLPTDIAALDVIIAQRGWN